MPQMMPLNWLTMFLSINLIMLSFMIILFNFFSPFPSFKTMKKNTSPLIKWMW